MRESRAARSGLFGLVVAATLGLAAASGGQTELGSVARAIEQVHAGSPEGIEALRRHPRAAAAALLDDLERRVGAQDEEGAVADLRALSELGYAGGEVVPRLIETVERDPEPDRLRLWLLHALADLAPSVTGPVAVELEEWADRRWNESMVARLIEARAKLANTRGRSLAPSEVHRLRVRLAGRSAHPLPALLALLASEDVDTAELAAERLALLGPAASAAVPELIELMDGPTTASVLFDGGGIRLPLADLGRVPSEAPLAAALALVAIAPREPASLRAHGYVVEHARPDQQVASLVLLRERADAPERLAELVLPALADRASRRVRREALVTLSGLGAGAAPAAAAVERISSEDDPELSALARSVLRAMRRP